MDVGREASGPWLVASRWGGGLVSPSVVLGEHISAPRVMCWFAPASTPRARPMPVRRLLQSACTPIATERGLERGVTRCTVLHAGLHGQLARTLAA